MSNSRTTLRDMGICVVAMAWAVGVAQADTANVRINEAYASHTGVDTIEFFELHGPPDSVLAGLTILVIDGDGNSKGRITHVIPVVGTLPASGLWVIGTPACPNPGVSDPPDQLLDSSLVSEILPNGTQTYLLVTGFAGWVNDDVDTNNDSEMDSTYLDVLGTIIDSVAVHDGGLSDATYAGAPVLGPIPCGSSLCVPPGVARKTDGLDSDTVNDWCIASFDSIPPSTSVGADGYEPASPGVANNYSCNSGPIAQSQEVPVPMDASPGVIITLVAIDDGLPDGLLEYTVASLPASGTLTDPDNGDAAVSVGVPLVGDRVRYTPAVGVTGTFSFTFTADDGELESGAATVTLLVYENAAPVAEDDQVAVEQDASPGPIITLAATDDAFPPGRVLVYTITSLPTLGTLTDPDDADAEVALNGELAANRVRYTPDPGEAGNDSFTFTVSDGELTSNTATVSVQVIQNTAPVAQSAQVSVMQDASPGLVIDLVATDDGLPGGPLVYSIVALPTRGTLTDPDDADAAVGAGGDLTANRVRYTPNPGQAGNDSFTFKANDGVLDSNVATVAVEIVGDRVVITEILYNAVGETAAAEAPWEYVEITNLTASTVALRSLLDNNNNTHNNILGSSIPGHATLIITNTKGSNPSLAEFMANWSPLQVSSVVFATAFPPLNNTGDTLTLVAEDGSVLDVVAYQAGSGWPASTEGRSIYLKDGHFSRSANDVGSNWALSVDGLKGAYTSTRGDVGSPAFVPGLAPGIPPVLTGAVSVRTQGTAGAFSIDVGTGAVESRANGPMSLVAEFDIPIQLAGGAGDVTVSSGTVTGLAVDGSTLTVTMSGAANASRLTVGFPGVADANDVTAVSESTLCVPVLAGDATGDRAVNIFDLVQIRNALNQPVTAANFRTDVNADGSVNIFDLVAVRNSLNTSVAACP